MLFTTEEISKMYSSPGNSVSEYMITHTWIPNGLRHIRGKRNSYLYKKEWIEEFLESQSIQNISNNKNIKKPIVRKMTKNCTYKVS